MFLNAKIFSHNSWINVYKHQNFFSERQQRCEIKEIIFPISLVNKTKATLLSIFRRIKFKRKRIMQETTSHAFILLYRLNVPPISKHTEILCNEIRPFSIASHK